MQDVRLTESAPLTEAATTTPAGTRRFRARLIEGDRQGSSGYYPATMLRECAGAFPARLPMYLDHPGLSEGIERPERSVRDLAGYLATDAVYESDGLYADVEVYPHVAPVIEAMAPNIGLSIRASGTVEPSNTESIRGPVVTALTEAASVDFVTAAGAGGRIVELLESARAAVAEAATVSDKPWGDFKASGYSIEQWRKACLIGPATASDSKGDYSLPVREPDGTLNRNGVHAAASALAGGRGGVSATAEQKRTAAQQLVRLYGQLGEDPPTAVANLAGKPGAADGKDGDGKTAAKKESARPWWLNDHGPELVHFAEGGVVTPLSEARNIGAWVEARIHMIFTSIADDMYGDGRLTRDERIALSKAIGDALKTFTSEVEQSAPQLYQRDLWDGPPDAVAETKQPGGAPGLTEGNTMAGSGASNSGGTDKKLTDEEKAKLKTEEEAAAAKKKADEEKKNPFAKESAASPREQELATELAEARRVNEANGTRMDEMEKRLAESEKATAEERARNRALENRDAAGRALDEALKAAGLPDYAHTRVREAAMRDLPVDDKGVLDAEKFAEATKKAVDAETAYITAVAEASGAGKPRGLGESTSTDAPTDKDLDAELQNQFKAFGLSESAASIAATGRN